jgi:hypothetical protein
VQEVFYSNRVDGIDILKEEGGDANNCSSDSKKMAMIMTLGQGLIWAA